MFESKCDLRDYAERAIRTSQTIYSLDPQTVLRDFPEMKPRNEVTLQNPRPACVPWRICAAIILYRLQSQGFKCRVARRRTLTSPKPLLLPHPSPLSTKIWPAPITDCSPARPGGPWLVPPCSPSPAPPKSAPGGCLSESITVYSLVHRTPLR